MADGGIVALLFTDLVGSTSMYDQLGDERAEALRRAHFAALRQALDAHGGREVKSLGDGLMVTFTSAVAAVDAAVAMQQSTNGAEVRVGLHAGEPVRDEDDYFGVSVNIARRLCDIAEPGQILASDLIRALVSPRMRSGLRSVGPVTLKGIEEALEAFAVEWSPLATSSGLPSFLGTPSDVEFVGRETELERLLVLWKAATAGGRALALVAGEPGIGKTRLVRELARRVVVEPSLLLAGRSDAELVIPLEPFAEAFRTALAMWPPEPRARLAAAIEPLFRVAGSSTNLPETERSTLFGAIIDALVQAEAHGPLLLVLDDLHWADEASLLLLRHLLRSPLTHILIVVTYRDTEVSRGHPLSSLLADLRREPDVHRLALRGIGSDEVLQLLGATGDDAARLASRITDETEGNPFFVTEVIGHLIEQGRVRPDGAATAIVGAPETIDVPEGVREVIGRRLSRLSPACNEILAAASVIGRNFPARLVAEVAEVTLDEALDAIDEALAARIVEADPSGAAAFTFGHALIRETLFAELSSVRRIRLHHRIGDALMRRGGPIAEVAHHLIEAAPAGPERAMGEAAVAAAEDARYRLAAYEDAASVSRRALAVLSEEHLDLRCDLLTVLGDSLTGIGDGTGIDLLAEALALSQRLADPERMARVAVYALRSGPPAGAVAVFSDASRDALELLANDASSPLRARLRSVLALVGEGTPLPDADAQTGLVLDEAWASQDEEAIAYASLARADVLMLRGDDRAAAEVLDAGLSAITEGLREAAVPFGNRYFALALLVGDRTRAEAEWTKLRTNLERVQAKGWTDELPRAGMAFLDGRLEEASELATHLQSTRPGQTLPSALLGMIALERGESAAVLPFLEAAAERSELAAWRAGLALFLVDVGRPDEARDKTTGVLAALEREIGSGFGAAMIAEVACALSATELAAGAAILLAPLRGLTASAGVLCLGAADRYLGLCAATDGRLDEAADLLEHALVLNTRLCTPLFEAHTQVDLAGVLLSRRGDGDEARSAQLLTAAAATALRLDLPRVARRAAAR